MDQEARGLFRELAPIMRAEHDAGDGHFSTDQVERAERAARGPAATLEPTAAQMGAGVGALQRCLCTMPLGLDEERAQEISDWADPIVLEIYQAMSTADADWKKIKAANKAS